MLPEQIWLDGISTSPGIVKQFVAAEMAVPRREKTDDSRGNTGSRNTKSSRERTDKYVHRHDEDEQTPIGASIEWQVTGRDFVGGIQLQIIPMFDIGGIFAGSIKDVCLKSGYHISYDDSLTSKVHVFDVLNTPRDEGLRDGDVIHIKDMNSQLEERPKVVGDLLDEAPVSLTSQDVVEVEIQYSTVDKCNFRVHLPGHSRPTVSLEVWKTCFCP